MQFRLEEAIDLLTRTPAVLHALLNGLPEPWIHTSAEEWSAFDVVGHLIHGERTDWLPRTQIILTRGETQTFPPFDRTGHVSACAGKSLGQLLTEFRTLREENLAALAALQLSEPQLALRGMHPALGPVALGEYLAAWAVHDLSHLHQLTRILAKHYRNACGPLRDYMGVLRE